MPESFLSSARLYLKSANESRFCSLVIHTLRDMPGQLDALLLDATALSTKEAARVAALASRLDPMLQPAWTSAFVNALEFWSEVTPPAPLIRQMEILARCTEPRRLLPILAPVCSHRDSRLRAKAVEITLEMSPNQNLPIGLDDANSRVRASAIEALWGRTDDHAIALFEKHSQASNHREAVNALLGLHQAGQLKARQGLMNFAFDTDSMFSIAAIWAIGQSRDPRLQRFLQSNLMVWEGQVRQAALRSARQLNQLRKQAESQPELQFVIRDVKRRTASGLQMEALLLDSNGETVKPPESLHPTQFLLREGEQYLDDAQFAIRASTAPHDLLVLLPANVAENEISQIQTALDAKPRNLSICVQNYAIHTARNLRQPTILDFSASSEPLDFRTVAAASLDAALENLTPMFPPRSNPRHLLIVTSGDATLHQPPSPDWANTLPRSGVSPHMILRRTTSPEISAAWREHCEALSGSYMECFRWDDLHQCIAQWLLHLQLSIRITTNIDCDGPLTLEYLSQAGCASHTFELPARPG